MTTPLPPATRLGIAIDMDALQVLMREFINEYPPDSPSRTEYEWRFSTFLYWLRKRRESPDSNILTFRDKKGVSNGTGGS